MDGIEFFDAKCFGISNAEANERREELLDTRYYIHVAIEPYSI